MAGLMLTNLLVAQNSNIKKGAVGFKVSYLDFKKTNLTEGLSTGVPAFGIQYFKGINSKLDFMTNLDLASIKYPYYTSLKIPAAKSNQTYAAIDFNLNFKLVKDDKKIVPYLTAGIGLGADDFSYYSAFAPIGAGIQIKAKYGSFVNIMSTYRAEVSSFTKMHYSHGISYTLPIKGRDKTNNQSFVSFNQTQIRDDLPIVILTNSNSASASELLAGALAINKRGTLIGDNTFGKWSVQSSFTLKDKSIFNITTQLFYAPKDATFQGDGIAPDIKIIDSNNQKAFREKDYKNYLKVSDLYKRSPKLKTKDTNCPLVNDADEKKDYVLGCAILYLKSNSDLAIFKNKLGL
jgi:hypothetical protein